MDFHYEDAKDLNFISSLKYTSADTIKRYIKRFNLRAEESDIYTDYNIGHSGLSVLFRIYPNDEYIDIYVKKDKDMCWAQRHERLRGSALSQEFTTHTKIDYMLRSMAAECDAVETAKTKAMIDLFKEATK